MQGIKSWKAGSKVSGWRPASGWLIGVCWCLLARTAPAQDFVAHVPLHPLTTDIGRDGVYAEEEVQGDPLPNNDPEPVETLSPEETARRIEQYRREAGKLGPNQWFSAIKFDFGLGLALAYDDNIRVSTNNAKEGDEVTTISGRIIASLGDYVARQDSFVFLDYSLWGNLFAVHGDQDSLDQNGLLDARYHWDRLSLELSSRAVVEHEATSDITERQSNEIYDEALVLRYRYSDKTTLVSEARVSLNNSEFGQDNQQYAVNEAIDYQLFERTSLGFGVRVGRLNSGDGLHETFESPVARLAYRVADKVSVSAQAGVDVRERGSYAGTGTTPVFMLESEWTPYDGTTLLLSGYRRVDASESLSGEDFTTTTVALTFQQRFLRHYFVLASFDYSHDDYAVVTGTGTNVPARTDDYYFFRIGLSYKALKYFDYGLFYRRQENDSNLGSYSYASNRVYLQFNFLY